MAKTGKQVSRGKTRERRAVAARKATHTSSIISPLPIQKTDTGVVDRQVATIKEPSRAEVSHAYIKNHLVQGGPPASKLDIVNCYKDSRFVLGDYVTLDGQHAEDIDSLLKAITEYAHDPTRRRPYNVVLQAEPGSGKSHFVECLAKKLSEQKVSDVTFDMSSIRDVEDFERPLEIIRNLKVEDKLPLLFLDEFDSNPEKYPLLLPLLWGGKLTFGHRELRLGKVIIVLAGSGAQVAKALKTAKNVKRKRGSASGKLIDLLSRINGLEITIPRLDEVDKSTGRDRRVDKVCLALSLLKKRFGSQLSSVPWALLRFVSETKFRYGVRSITHFIDAIPPVVGKAAALTLENLKLPIESVSQLAKSPIAPHLISGNGLSPIVARWKKLQKCTTSVKFDIESYSGPFRFWEIFGRAQRPRV